MYLSSYCFCRLIAAIVKINTFVRLCYKRLLLKSRKKTKMNSFILDVPNRWFRGGKEYDHNTDISVVLNIFSH